MKLTDSLLTAWLSLNNSRLRSLLTMLGVIFGVAAVIAMVAVGQGATRQVTAQVQGLGANLVVIVPAPGKGARFMETEAAALLQRVPSLVAASPVLQSNVTAAWGAQSETTALWGATPVLFSIQDRSLAAGRVFSTEEVNSHRPVAVLGSAVAQTLFGVQRAVGQTITVNGEPFRVVGVMASKGGSNGQNLDDQILVPVTSAENLLGTRFISAIYAQARSGPWAAVAVGHVEAIYTARYNRDDAVRVLSQDQLLSVVQGVAGTLTLFLGAVAGISLLVGGIGIMNIMLVSVSERTREIGLRLAMGATRRDLLQQFLIEAVVLSMSGGLLGVALGLGLARAVGGLLHNRAEVSLPSVALAFGFSVAVGLVFGLWPAARASRLDPIDALRTE